MKTKRKKLKSVQDSSHRVLPRERQGSTPSWADLFSIMNPNQNEGLRNREFLLKRQRTGHEFVTVPVTRETVQYLRQLADETEGSLPIEEAEIILREGAEMIVSDSLDLLYFEKPLADMALKLAEHTAVPVKTLVRSALSQYIEAAREKGYLTLTPIPEYLPNDLSEEIDTHAAAMGFTRSALIRLFLKAGVFSVENGEGVRMVKEAG